MKILIFGGSGSAGRAIVSSVATNDNEVVVYDLNPENVRFPEKYSEGSAKFLDVTNSDDFDSVCFEKESICDEYDVVIYNIAATTESLAKNQPGQNRVTDALVADLDPDIWQLMLDTNVTPVFRLVSGMSNFLSRVTEDRPLRLKRVIVTSSIYGRAIPDFRLYTNRKIVTYPGYGASKAALEYLVRWSATYFGEHGVSFNCVALGGVFNGHSREFEEAYSERVALKRMARTDDIQGIYEFLLSQKANFITGQIMYVDGGYLP